MSLHRRLEKLEDLEGRRAARSAGTPRYLQRYFKEIASLRRQEAGLDPLPYTPEDLADDKRCLEEVIPLYRADPGWQTEEAQRFCDQWEQHIRENLAKGADPE